MIHETGKVRALVLRESHKGICAAVEQLPASEIPAGGDVTVRVLYSSLNYKDALAVTNRGKIIRGDYPFVPGIDLAGEVLESDSPRFARGDMVIGTGWGLGEDQWGGYSETLRLRSDGLVEMPAGMQARDAMGIGTAGFTAMLSVLVLEENDVAATSGEVVVTGASGGVGSFAVALLAGRGHDVVASSGKSEAAGYLTALGATRIIERSVLSEGARRPLDSGTWAGAVDTVGGKTLETLLSQTRRHGCVASCGLVGGAELHTTVYPFILRGVKLIGIDSNTCPSDQRVRAWKHLAREMELSLIREMTQVIDLEEVPRMSEKMLRGEITGRIVVRLSGA